jgi:hypothetical protein
VFKDQVDKQITSTSSELKSLQNTNYSLSNENRVLKEKVFEASIKEEELFLKFRNQEKEILNYQEIIHKKERSLQEEKLRNESISSSIASIRKEYEKSQDSLTASVSLITKEKENVIKHYQQELESLQKEFQNQLPKLIEKSISKYSSTLNESFSKKLYEMKNGYEKLLERKSQEMDEIQRFYHEKELKSSLTKNDEKISLEYYERRNKELLQEKEYYENGFYDLKKQNKLLEINQTTAASMMMVPYPLAVPPPSSSSSVNPSPILFQQPQQHQQTQQSQQFHQSQQPQRHHQQHQQPVVGNPPSSVMSLPSSSDQHLPPPPSSSSSTFDTVAYLNQQLQLMKEQITSSLQSSLSQSIDVAAMSNKENEAYLEDSRRRERNSLSSSSSSSHKEMISSLEFPRSIISSQQQQQQRQRQGQVNVNNSSRMNDLLFTDEEASLFISPQRKGRSSHLPFSQGTKQKKRVSSFTNVSSQNASAESKAGEVPIMEESEVDDEGERGRMEEEQSSVDHHRRLHVTFDETEIREEGDDGIEDAEGEEQQEEIEQDVKTLSKPKKFQLPFPSSSSSSSSYVNAFVRKKSTFDESEVNKSSINLNHSVDGYRNLYFTPSGQVIPSSGGRSKSRLSSASSSSSSLLLNSSIELLDELPSFDNLRDGGYYEGYWKAKYSKFR